MPEIHAIIPARGGSKGFPGKNLTVVSGRSLLARSVAAVSAAGFIATVSTDDREIAAAAVAAGAIVVDRPAALAHDLASSESALLHALGVLSAADDDIALLVQCTSPFLTGTDIAGVAEAIDAGADTAFVAVPFHRFVWREVDGDAVGVNHDRAVRERRQDRIPEWLEAGSVYAMRVGGLRRYGHRFFGHTVVVPTSSHDLEVDAPRDLEVARLLTPSPIGWPWATVPRLLVCDFDGVMTDDRVWTDEKGVESVVCGRGDGLGVAVLRERLPLVVLSTEVNGVVGARCRKLGVRCVQGVGLNKLDELHKIVADAGLSMAEVAYVGNDVNDLGPLRTVGFPIAVADAHLDVRAAAGLVLSRDGGRGAVRELSELLVGALGKLPGSGTMESPIRTMESPI